MSKVISRPQINTRWVAKIGNHKGLEVTVVKVSTTMVYLKQGHGRVSVNGSSQRGAILELPIDAFFRRYERY